MSFFLCLTQARLNLFFTHFCHRSGATRVQNSNVALVLRGFIANIKARVSGTAIIEKSKTTVLVENHGHVSV